MPARLPKLPVAVAASLLSVSACSPDYDDEIMEQVLMPCFQMPVLMFASTEEEALEMATRLMEGQYAPYAELVRRGALAAVQGKSDDAERKAIYGRYMLLCIDEVT